MPARLFLPASETARGPFPLLVWAHGFDATVDYFDSLLRTIAAHGYVVVAPIFPLTRTGAAGGSVYGDYVNQPADVSFVIGQVLDHYGPSGTARRGLVDPTRIAVGGHSLGAVTTMALASNKCCLDARVKAAVEIDGSPLPFPHGASVQRGVPVLFIHGDADRHFPVAGSRAMFVASRPPKYLVVLHGVPHTPFGIPAANAVILAATVDFLGAYLQQSSVARHRLQHDIPVPGFAMLTFVE